MSRYRNRPPPRSRVSGRRSGLFPNIATPAVLASILGPLANLGRRAPAALPPEPLRLRIGERMVTHNVSRDHRSRTDSNRSSNQPGATSERSRWIRSTVVRYHHTISNRRRSPTVREIHVPDGPAPRGGSVPTRPHFDIPTYDLSRMGGRRHSHPARSNEGAGTYPLGTSRLQPTASRSLRGQVVPSGGAGSVRPPLANADGIPAHHTHPPRRAPANTLRDDAGRSRWRRTCPPATTTTRTTIVPASNLAGRECAGDVSRVGRCTSFIDGSSRSPGGSRGSGRSVDPSS